MNSDVGYWKTLWLELTWEKVCFFNSLCFVIWLFHFSLLDLQTAGRLQFLILYIKKLFKILVIMISLVFYKIMANQFTLKTNRGCWIQHYMSICWMTIFLKKKKNTKSSYTTSKQKVMQNYSHLHLKNTI